MNAHLALSFDAVPVTFSSNRSVGIKQFSRCHFVSDEDIEEPAFERCLERRELILTGGNHHDFSGLHHLSDFFGTERGKDVPVCNRFPFSIEKGVVDVAHSTLFRQLFGSELGAGLITSGIMLILTINV